MEKNLAYQHIYTHEIGFKILFMSEEVSKSLKVLKVAH